MINRFNIPVIIILLAFVFACEGRSPDELLDESGFISLGADITAPSALQPFPGDTVLNLKTIIEWSQKNGALTYTVEIATDPGFVNQITGSPVTVQAPKSYLSVAPDGDISLPDGRTYYWRVRADTTVAGHYGSSYFEAMDDSIYVHCPEGEECDDFKCKDAYDNYTACVGNRGKPYRTVATAISDAPILRLNTIKVAARGGSAYYEEFFTIGRGIVLEGGYDSDFNEGTKDPSVNVTIIASPIDAAVTLKNIMEKTLVQGFTLKTLDGIGDLVGVRSLNCSSNVELNNCRIHGGGTLSGISYGIYIVESDITITNCMITTGDAEEIFGIYSFTSGPVLTGNSITTGNSVNGNNYGIYCDEEGSIVLTGNSVSTGSSEADNYGYLSYDVDSVALNNNTISTGSAEGDLYGAYIEGTANASLTDNGISTSDTSYSYNYGVYIDSTTISMAGNTITAGSGSLCCGVRASYTDGMIDDNIINAGNAQYTTGMECVSGSLNITNNTIVSGIAEDYSYGLSINNSSPVVSGNSITAGEAPNYNNYGIYYSGSSNAVITNNYIISSIAKRESYGIYISNNNNHTLTGNHVTSGDVSSGYYSYGIYINGTSYSATLTGNIITAGNASGTNADSIGVFFNTTTTIIKLNRNTISSGAASRGSYGVACWNSSVNFTNSIIRSDAAVTSSGIYLAYPSSDNIQIYNNTVITRDATNNYGILISNATSPVTVSATNNIFMTTDLSDSRYGVYDANNSATTSSTTNAFYGFSLDHYNIDTVTGAITGIDPLLDEDYRPTTASPCDITTGGTDLSGIFTVDRDDYARTVSWSMGAFEWDDTCN